MIIHYVIGQLEGQSNSIIYQMPVRANTMVADELDHENLILAVRVRRELRVQEQSQER